MKTSALLQVAAAIVACTLIAEPAMAVDEALEGIPRSYRICIGLSEPDRSSCLNSERTVLIIHVPTWVLLLGNQLRGLEKASTIDANRE